MYFLSDFCCICLRNENDLKTSFSNENSHYLKLLSVVPEMCLEQLKKKLACKACCDSIDAMHEFREKCLRNNRQLLCYVTKLHSSDNVYREMNITLTDLKHENDESKDDKNSVIVEDFKSEISEIVKTEIDENVSSPDDGQVEDQTQALHIEEVQIDTLEPPLLKEEPAVEDNSNNEDFFVSNSLQTGTIRVANIDIIRDEEEEMVEIIEEKSEENTQKEDKTIDSLEQQDVFYTNYIVKRSADSPAKGSTSAQMCFKKPTVNAPCDEESLSKENINVTKNRLGTHKCNLCGEIFHKLTSLKFHIKNHSTPFECTLCDKRFVRKANFTTHMRLHSSSEVKKYQCRFCKASFAGSVSLSAHEKIHSAMGTHQCHFCNESFNQETLLTIHLGKHNENRPFNCSICHKNFKEKASLTRHFATHTGERNFKCSICGNCYSDESYLLRHMRTHNGNKFYKCSVCKKGFHDPASRFRHKVLVHH